MGQGTLRKSSPALGDPHGIIWSQTEETLGEGVQDNPKSSVAALVALWAPQEWDFGVQGALVPLQINWDSVMEEGDTGLSNEHLPATTLL